MKIESKVIQRLNEAIKEAHLREDRQSIERLTKKRNQYLARWLK